MIPILVLLFLFVLGSILLLGLWWNGRTANAVITAVTVADSRAGVAGALQWVGERTPKQRRRGDPLRRMLYNAGYRSASAASVFRGLTWVCVAVLAFFGVLAGLSIDDGNAMLGALSMGGLGYFLPEKILKAMGERRRKRLRAGLPSAIDLMVLSIEAGQSLDAALLETARGIRKAYPELAAEFSALNGDLRANTSRTESLRAFADRSGDSEFRKLANLLNDTDRFGTSLGPALRNHARYLRIRVKQQAQEAARKVGVKLIFPVFFLIFPSVILVTLGPAVIMISKQMKSYMAL
ncbi:hypothetical protein F183_A45430 [Bryobacterales bacterium F-183]|nr:hypothetical protein F183_A45430 [Bryobacterales bacterium F-183]